MIDFQKLFDVIYKLWVMSCLLVIAAGTLKNNEIQNTPTSQSTNYKHPDGRDDDGYLWINGKTPADKNQNGQIDDYER